MNCEALKDNLHEYLDESLPAGEMMEARQHLAGCSFCRKLVQQEQRLVGSFAASFEKAVGNIALDAEAKRRIAAAVKSAPEAASRPRIIPLWARLALPLAAAAAVVVFVIGGRSHFVGYSVHTPTVASRDRVREVSIDISFCEPEYTFVSEGDFVIDTLTCEPRIANGKIIVSN